MEQLFQTKMGLLAVHLVAKEGHLQVMEAVQVAQ
jgi:hypothetical protein